MKMNNQKGIALISVVLLVGIFLAIVAALSAVFVNKIRPSGDARRAVVAFYAAEAGGEWCWALRQFPPPFPIPPAPTMLNGANYRDNDDNALDEFDCLASAPLDIIGVNQGIKRHVFIDYD